MKSCFWKVSMLCEDENNFSPSLQKYLELRKSNFASLKNGEQISVRWGWFERGIIYNIWPERTISNVQNCLFLRCSALQLGVRQSILLRCTSTFHTNTFLVLISFQLTSKMYLFISGLVENTLVTWWVECTADKYLTNHLPSN